MKDYDGEEITTIQARQGMRVQLQGALHVSNGIKQPPTFTIYTLASTRLTDYGQARLWDDNGHELICGREQITFGGLRLIGWDKEL